MSAPDRYEDHLPDFLVIGAPRSGTTWLLRNLSAHPEVFMVDREMHFFDRHYDRGWDWYAAHFVPGFGLVRGEKTPAYAHLPSEMIDALYRELPRARLVYIVRDPVERAWSEAVNVLVKKPRRTVENLTTADFLRFFRSSDSWEMGGDYLRNIDRWTRRFPREQLHIELYDEIESRPRHVLERILCHIGASADVEWTRPHFDERVNRTPTAVMPPEVRDFLSNRYRHELAPLVSELGDGAAGWCAA